MRPVFPRRRIFSVVRGVFLMYNASMLEKNDERMLAMGCFLLNERGEVLLEMSSGLRLAADMQLEVDEYAGTAVLKSSDGGRYDIGFVHKELMFPLKKNRYLFVVERNNQFYAMNSTLAKVVFVN